MARIIGVAGTAKNTGKTTTTSALIRAASKKGKVIGLTGIGYDGEEIDNITGLPKPRLALKAGTVIATAKRCLLAGTAKFEVMETSDIITPLGRIYIARVTSEGLVIIAGPNKGSELKYVLERMQNNAKCSIIIVDGALNRIAPMVETQGIILATGASKNTDIEILARETRALDDIFSLDSVDNETKTLLENQQNIAFVQNNKVIKSLKYGFLVDKTLVEEISLFPYEYDTLYIPALVAKEMLKQLNILMCGQWQGKKLIVKDSTKLIVGGKPLEISKILKDFIAQDVSVQTLIKLPLIAVTVNPFFPRYRFNSKVYEADHVDKNRLKHCIGRALSIPVIDIMLDGSDKLLQIIS